MGVVIYGGAGNDTIKGSQIGDYLAGGSGNDTIYGNAGDDQIYGDSGINVDVISRVLSFPTVNASATPNADGLVAGQDSIDGGTGQDIIFGDHGIITQAVPDVQRILYSGQIADIRTTQPGNGVADTIIGGTGFNRIFGGGGSDAITGGDDGNIVFGDQGHLAYNLGDFLAFDATGNPVIGANGNSPLLDVAERGHRGAIWRAGHPTGAGADSVICGRSGDTSDAGAGQNVVFGGHGQLLRTGAGWGLIWSIDPTVANGGGDTITTGIGSDRIFGGQGNDTINAYASSGGTAASDASNIVFGDFGAIDYAAPDFRGMNALGVNLPGIDDHNPATADIIQSVFTSSTYGGVDRSSQVRVTTSSSAARAATRSTRAPARTSCSATTARSCGRE